MHPEIHPVSSRARPGVDQAYARLPAEVSRVMTGPGDNPTSKTPGGRIGPALHRP